MQSGDDNTGTAGQSSAVIPAAAGALGGFLLALVLLALVRRRQRPQGSHVLPEGGSASAASAPGPTYKNESIGLSSSHPSHAYYDADESGEIATYEAIAAGEGEYLTALPAADENQGDGALYYEVGPAASHPLGAHYDSASGMAPAEDITYDNVGVEEPTYAAAPVPTCALGRDGGAAAHNPLVTSFYDMGACDAGDGSSGAAMYDVASAAERRVDARAEQGALYDRATSGASAAAEYDLAGSAAAADDGMYDFVAPTVGSVSGAAVYDFAASHSGLYDFANTNESFRG